MRFQLAVCAMAAVIATEAAAKDKARPNFRKDDIPESKLDLVAKRLQSARNRVKKLEEEIVANLPRHLQDASGFDSWLACQEENGDMCPSQDTADSAFWDCYAFDDGCDSATHAGWYSCYWYADCETYNAAV